MHKLTYCLTLSFSNRIFLCQNARHHGKLNLSTCHHATIDLDDRPREYADSPIVFINYVNTDNILTALISQLHVSGSLSRDQGIQDIFIEN